jgi:hypothetical protein
MITRNPNTLYVYEQVMQWLEMGKSPTLVIPLRSPLTAVTLGTSPLPEIPPVERRVMFLRGMGGSRPFAIHQGKTGVMRRIYYDPHWRGYLGIERILSNACGEETGDYTEA